MSKLIPKTHAKSVYCLTDKDVEALPAVEKRNPRSRNGPMMKLYDKAQLEAAAHRKWGGPEGLAAEQRRREDRRAARAATATATATATAAAAQCGVPVAGADAGEWDLDVAAPGSAPAPPSAAPSGRSPVRRPNAAFAWLGLPPLVSERIREVLPLPLAATVAMVGPTATAVGSAATPAAAAGPTVAAAAVSAHPPAGPARQLPPAPLPPPPVPPPAPPGSAAGHPGGSRVRDGDVEMIDLAGSSTCSSSSSSDESADEEGSEERCPDGTWLGGRRPPQPTGRPQRRSPRGQSQPQAGGGLDDLAGAGAGDGGSIVLLSSDDEVEDEAEGAARLRDPDTAGVHPTAGAPAAPPAAAAVDGDSGGGWMEGGGGAATTTGQPQPSQQLQPPSRGTTGEHVLYWMKTAVRGHENPALDAARAAAGRLRLPLRVAAFVTPACQPYVNHRRVKFLLEGLRDAQRELRDQGLDLLVHVDGYGPPAPETPNAGSGVGSSNNSSGGGADAGGGGGGGGGRILSRVNVSGPGWEALLAAARRAALVVTEDMPVDPDAAWLAALVRQLKLDRMSAGRGGGAGEDAPAAHAAAAAAAPPPWSAPGLWAVDTACIVPVQLVGRPYEKAYAYRSATEGLRRHRLRAVYSGAAAAAAGAATTAAAPATAAPTQAVGGPMGRFLEVFSRGQDGAPRPMGPRGASSRDASSTAAAGAAAMEVDGDATGRHVGGPGTRGDGGDGGGGGGGPLGWPSLDLQRPDLDLAALAASLPGVDCTVKGVTHLVGGGSRAGYRRWEDWRRGGGVGRYAATRNDAMQRSGTSRMSPYFRWGMVSPFRIAREAAASGGSGAAKFLDELLVWRELSYSFCFHKYPLLESLSVLPRWAQDTLAAHAADPRVTKSLRQLETGSTGDALWDAAQRQLAAHGELHNNVRMTWGKAPLAWCASPQGALDAVLHLNHRYALDGCDPSSYGGVLWCFGLFDAPKAAAGSAVSGSLRRRPTAAHARRLDPGAYGALPP